jgi:hypothetical protein
MMSGSDVGYSNPFPDVHKYDFLLVVAAPPVPSGPYAVHLSILGNGVCSITGYAHSAINNVDAIDTTDGPGTLPWLTPSTKNSVWTNNVQALDDSAGWEAQFSYTLTVPGSGSSTANLPYMNLRVFRGDPVTF